MTEPKLREARIARAKEMAEQEVSPGPGTFTDRVLHHLFALIDAYWRPEPEVDAVTLAAREWINSPANVDATYADAFRAGHAHARETCADVRRMDWLEKQQNVTVDLLQPGGFLQCSGDADTLRTKIDRAMEGGE